MTAQGIPTKLDLIIKQLVELRAYVHGKYPSGKLYSIVGNYCVFGCKVTQGFSASDMLLALDGQAVGDESHLNPDIEDPPTRYEHYPNMALVYGEVFLKKNVNKTTEEDDSLLLGDAPGTSGYGRYDVIYLYMGHAGPGIGILQGTASTDCYDDFQANGLEQGAYPQTYDPTGLPAGVMVVARVYVQYGDTGIGNARIADLRDFVGRLQTVIGSATPPTITIGDDALLGSGPDAAREDSKIKVHLPGLRDGRFERLNADTGRLVGLPGTSKKIEVNGEYTSLASNIERALTAGNYLLNADGSISTSNPAANTNYYAYLLGPGHSTNPNELRYSATAPNSNGYLGTTGDAAHCRHVGWCGTDGSTQIADNMAVASEFNPITEITTKAGTGIGTTNSSTDWESILGITKNILMPPNWKAYAIGKIRVQHDTVAKLMAMEVRLNDASINSSIGSMTGSIADKPVTIISTVSLLQSSLGYVEFDVWTYVEANTATYMGNQCNMIIIRFPG